MLVKQVNFVPGADECGFGELGVSGLPQHSELVDILMSSVAAVAPPVAMQRIIRSLKLLVYRAFKLLVHSLKLLVCIIRSL